MTKVQYTHDELGTEVEAPWGYYQPLEEGSVEHAGRKVLYTLGSACIEVSCCGQGSWQYARVEGYVLDGDSTSSAGGGLDTTSVELETVEGSEQRAAVAKLIQDKHPGVRVEFR